MFRHNARNAAVGDLGVTVMIMHTHMSKVMMADD